MSDQLTLDVIDRPAAGALRTMLRLRALRRDRPAGLRALVPLGTGHFVTRMRPSPTPRRIAVLAAWEDDDAVEDRWRQVLSGLATGAREHWHVRGEMARASFTEPWKGWMPDTAEAEPLADDEPALVLISGDLRVRGIREFTQDIPKTVAHAFEHPGYLGGLGLFSSWRNTTSCSTWRTYADTRDYAFRQGRHAAAMRRDRAHQNHRTEWFSRIRPLAERGTLNGASPFAAVLGDRVVAGS